MTNETKTEDRNLVVAWLTAGLMILACVFFAFWGSNATDQPEQIAERSGLVADPLIAPSTPTVATDAGKPTDQANSTRDTRNLSELPGGERAFTDKTATPQDATESSTDINTSHASTDAATIDSDATTVSLDDSAIANSSQDHANVDPLSSDAAEANTEIPSSENNTIPEFELASQAPSEIAGLDPLSEDLGLNEIVTPPTEDPVSSADVANINTFGELAEQLSDETSSLDNGAIAESPTTDLPNAADASDNVPVAGEAEPPVVAIAEPTTAPDSQPSITDTASPIATDTPDFVPSNVEKPLANSQPVESSAATSTAPDTNTGLANDTKSLRPFLGVGIRETGGSVVTTLYDNSTATNLGLKLGDRLTKLNEDSVYDLPSIKKALAKLKVGDKTKITLVRDGTTMEFGPAALTAKKK